MERKEGKREGSSFAVHCVALIHTQMSAQSSILALVFFVFGAQLISFVFFMYLHSSRDKFCYVFSCSLSYLFLNSMFSSLKDNISLYVFCSVRAGNVTTFYFYICCYSTVQVYKLHLPIYFSTHHQLLASKGAQSQFYLLSIISLQQTFSPSLGS